MAALESWLRGWNRGSMFGATIPRQAP